MSIKKLSIYLLVLTLVLSLVGCGDKHDKSYVNDTADYTYRTAVNSMPTGWNNHTYQSNDATYVMNYTEDALYVFDYNETKDGYKIVNGMANAAPKDVTSSYIGKYGIEEGAEHQVYEIELKTWLKYDNGDPITANDFVKSVELLLNPKAANYRADSMYSGNLKIHNAENYLKGGSYGYSNMVSADYLDEEYVALDSFVVVDGYYTYDGKDIVLNINDGGNWGSALSLYNAYGYISTNADGYALLEGAADAEGYVKLTPELYMIASDIVAELHGYDNAEAYAADEGDYAYQEVQEMLFYGFEYPVIDFSEVGFFAKNDKTLVIVLDKPLTGFYLNYALSTNFFLVHVPTYLACESMEGGVYTNTYGTSVDTYVGHGPYALTTFIDGSEMKMTRNAYWHGYYEKEHEGQYMTTAVSFKQVSEAATRLEMFLKGELDGYGLQAEDMADYQGSDFTYYTEGDSTWFIALNPNEEALATAEANASPATPGNAVVKRIICIKEFRQALSFSLDRAAYSLALDPTGAPAKALYGNMIISDPENGVAYRTTDEAKQVIVDFWGLTDEIGEGKEYATIDEAIESITGYDLAGAKELFNAAYDKAVEAGYIPADNDKWEIQIIIGQPGSGSSKYYNNGYVLLSQVWTDAVVGTKLEGHLVFTQSQPLGSSAFSSYLKNNSIDLLFGVGWTGSALDPYGLIEAYVAPRYQYDASFDYSVIDVVVNVDGKDLVTDALSWYKALSGEDVEIKVVDSEETVTVNAGTNADAKVRLDILAALEGIVLQQYNMIPINLDASAALKGMRIKYYTEEYIYGVGRGGVQYYTYAMNDAEWAAYVAEQGGTLDYK
ncbi:MAG: ABC transporter substrate-binding protein [Erysipelotrichaceae bacterium]|jgi:ABC-type oligopeptide transport system substrate-binding subunit